MVEESNLATTKQLSLSTMFATTAQVDTVQFRQTKAIALWSTRH